MQECGQRLRGFEVEAPSMQRANFAQRRAAAFAVDAIQRPTIAGAGDVAAQCVATGACTADADDAPAHRRQQAGNTGLADPQRLPKRGGGQRAIATEQVFNLACSSIGHEPIE